MNKIHVIGIGYRPFDAKARQIVLNADIILSSTRLMEVFPSYVEYDTVKEKVLVINRIDELMDHIRENLEGKRIVLLASGDPLFFGIGRKVLDEFGPGRVELFPDLSSIQLAFSKVKETWDNAFLMSLHGGPDPEKRRRLPYELEAIPSLLETHPKIAVLTDRENNPAVIASALRAGSPAEQRAGAPRPYSLIIHVCERLGYPDEKITSGTPEEIARKTFDGPNVVIIMNRRGGAPPPLSEAENPGTLKPSFGLTEDEITHSRGLITKDEVRAVTIHKLKLPQKGVLWDIGAGSGSVSVEAARLFPGLKVYAIERDREQLANIEENKKKFTAANIAITNGEAPEVLGDLPSPDRVFIGGSGGQLSGIMRRIREKMRRGIVVINAVTLDTLNEAILLFENNGFEPEVSQVFVSRAKMLGGQRQMSGLNPVFVIRGEKR
jgi:precorrin-6Y C5,15-methyltransferase (decarboxylating)